MLWRPGPLALRDANLVGAVLDQLDRTRAAIAEVIALVPADLCVVERSVRALLGFLKGGVVIPRYLAA